MKKSIIFIFVLLAVLKIQAQDYLINFAGAGATSVIGSIKVNNLTSGATVTLNGGDILHLVQMVGVGELDKTKENLDLYPNPMVGQALLTFVTPENGNAVVCVFDLSGKTIYKISKLLTPGSHSFRISGLNNGIYIIKVSGKSYNYSKKLISLNNLQSKSSIEYLSSESTTKSPGLKSREASTAMAYSEGDLLLYQSLSGKYSTIVTDVPTGSKMITFKFVACTDANGNNYPVVQIGTKIWMAENLKTTKYRNGELIPNVIDNTQWSGLRTGAYCDYDNRIEYSAIYGKLYNWHAVLDSRKIAPVGWHISSVAEWETLNNNLANDLIANKIKEYGNSHWKYGSSGTTNESGFTALPAGKRDGTGKYSSIESLTSWWTSTEFSIPNANVNKMTDISSGLTKYNDLKESGFSIRCVSDIDLNAVLPVVYTTPVQDITRISAKCGGQVRSDGGSAITSRGICWSTNQEPSISDAKTNDILNLASFISNISGLSPNTTFYLRAYATNSAGTGYGKILSFKTNVAVVPILTTTVASNIKTNKATMGGSISDDGASTITTKGICWSTKPNPTIVDNKTSNGNGTSSFSADIIGLSPTTVYYARAYATNSVGTGYGDVFLFKTFSGTVTDIEGNVYNTIIIGTQEWMVENLKTTKYNDGESIPNAPDISLWSNRGTPAFCWYNNNISNKNIYGALYNWHAIGTGKLSPAGWHIPSQEEWNTLITFLGTSALAANKLKESGTAHWNTTNIDATNLSGFTALPAGDRTDIAYLGFFSFLGEDASWWSSTEYYSTAYLCHLNNGTLYNGTFYYNVSISTDRSEQKDYGYSIRCVKQGPPPPSVITSDVKDININSATAGGNVTDIGGSPVTARGVCYSTSPNPTLANSFTINGSGAGSFTSALSGLTANTPYYVRAYATNNDITSYGAQFSFSTFFGKVSDSDGNTYNTIKIGTQIWMVENLKTTKYNDGTPIPPAQDSVAWRNLSTPGYCWYNKDAAYKNIYGALYNWFTVNTGKLAPAGWHVSSDADWTTLITFLGGEILVGAKLKEAGSTHWLSPNTGATNETGFTALPGGYRASFGTFMNVRDVGEWWSSTEGTTDKAWTRYLFSSTNQSFRSNFNKLQGLSVRCVKD
jgi:uncharacterized protein (TIGR02145 family)